MAVNELHVGSRIQPFTEGFTGDMVEVLLWCGVMNDEERIALGEYVETKYGIDVFNPAPSLFSFTEISFAPGPGVDEGTVNLTWESESGKTYRIESIDMLDGTWTVQATGIPGDPGTTTRALNFTNFSALNRLYFRVGEE